MKTKKYTAKYFKKDMPLWKKRKDPLICRYFYRAISYYGSAFCANKGITANQVSYFSMLIAVLASALFLPHSRLANVIGAILVNIWLILDCVDGNIARSVKKEPFGEFADAISGYTLTVFLYVALGYYTYVNGGVLFEQGNAFPLLFGSLAAVFDSLTRLIYQKFKNTERELTLNSTIVATEDLNGNHEKTGNIKVKLGEALGLGGYLPAVILLATVFEIMDIVVIYVFLYEGAFCLAGTSTYIRKAIKYEKQ